MIDKKYELLANKTVLYIEDDLVFQQNIVEILNNFFKKIITARDGDEAYDIYISNQNEIDLIITDINMPNTNGILFSKIIRKFDKNLPIIIVSAYTETDYLLDSIDLNIITYIIKPFTTQKIIKLLDKLLEYFRLNNYFIINEHIKLNYEGKELIVNNDSIKLTKKESLFLRLLFQNNIVSYEMMYDYLWDGTKPPTINAIKSFIKKLKKKLPYDLIKNQHGIGYFLNTIYRE
jgi:DNA-binding response OmpR family regulator